MEKKRLREQENFVSWLLSPITVTQFFHDYFEKKFLYIDRKATSYFCRGDFSIPWSAEGLVKLAEDNNVFHGSDYNVVKYCTEQKKRITMESSEKIDAKMLRHWMDDGWSVRVLRPHQFSPQISRIISFMEEEFGCSGGSNSYWTPKGSQGFAPHYDDVDVFLLQLEGSKLWNLYLPPLPEDVLSRHSSEDYTPESLPSPAASITLKAGDVLYMPRGTIHQGRCLGEHSLHITLSINQMHSWADFMLCFLRNRIETIAANSVSWRRSVDANWMNSLGAVHSRAFRDQYKEGASMKSTVPLQREALLKHTRQLLLELFDDCQKSTSIDTASDMFACDVIVKRQPPPNPRQSAPTLLTSETRIALRCPQTSVRLVMNCPGEVQVFHTGVNSTVTPQQEEGKLRYEEDFASALSVIVDSPRDAVCIGDLPMPAFEVEDGAENRLILVRSLINSGVCVVERKPIE